MLLLPGGYNGEVWTTSKNNVVLDIREHWLEKYFPFFYLEATKRTLFQVVSSWFLVLLSPGQFPQIFIYVSPTIFQISLS
jgi:hypothetical protein